MNTDTADIVTTPASKSELMLRVARDQGLPIVDVPLLDSPDPLDQPYRPQIRAISNLMPTSMTRCYELDGQLYVPHYAIANTYVGPGLSERSYSVETLTKHGAKRTSAPLWPRYWMHDTGRT